MFRPRAPRPLAAASISIALLLGVLGAGVASAADNRVVYFGDPATATEDPSGNRVINVSPFTANGVFTFDVLARNDGNQNLTHVIIGVGSGAAARAGWDTASKPSLPPGATVIGATLDGAACTIAADRSGATCQTGSLGRNDEITATFVVQAGSYTGPSWAYATLRVAENVNDVGANTNSFFADDSDLLILPTNSNGYGTYQQAGEALTATTKGLAPVANDKQTTKVEVPGATGGVVSLIETEVDQTGCSPACIGQTVSANVRNGDEVAPYLQWTLEILSTSQTASKGGIYHTLDTGEVVRIANTEANACTAKKTVDCIVSYAINKKTGLTTIVFRTETNGAVRAN